MDEKVVSPAPETPEATREIGKNLLKTGDPDKVRSGLEQILRAYLSGDGEAAFMVADLMLKGFLHISEVEDQEEYALNILCKEANRGNAQARALLNAHCKERYDRLLSERETTEKSGRLTDFDGKTIRIKRKGLSTPIDTELKYKNGQNVLTLKVNILFCDSYRELNQDKFEEAVLAGIKEWEGTYKVFGNQELKVVMKVTTDFRLIDSVYVTPLTEETQLSLMTLSNLVGPKKNEQNLRAVLSTGRSFAKLGQKKWTARSRKKIYIQSDNGKFDDYEEIKHVAKHEFGHALGLGDMYESACDKLKGVEKGSYFELDGYHISNKLYNLVMCDHHGPISANDIEMVVLAFRENRMQLYQPKNFKGKISAALGRGN